MRPTEGMRTLPETNMEIQTGPCKDYSPSKGAIGVSMLGWWSGKQAEEDLHILCISRHTVPFLEAYHGMRVLPFGSVFVAVPRGVVAFLENLGLGLKH